MSSGDYHSETWTSRNPFRNVALCRLAGVSRSALIFGTLVAFLSVAGAVFASSAVTGVNITADLRRVIIKFEGSEAGRSGFSVSCKPNKLVVDVSGATLGKVQTSTRAGRGMGLDVRVSSSGEGIRALLDFGRSPVPDYRVRWMGRFLTIFLGEWSPTTNASDPPVSAKKPPRVAPPAAPSRHVAKAPEARKEESLRPAPVRPRAGKIKRPPSAEALQVEPGGETGDASALIAARERPGGAGQMVRATDTGRTDPPAAAPPLPRHAPATVKAPQSPPKPPKEVAVPEKPGPTVARPSLPSSDPAIAPPGKESPDLQARPLRSDSATYYVFLYGSDMNHTDLMAWLDAHGFDSSLILEATPAALDGYDFVWNYYSSDRAGGAVNLEPKSDTTVYGLLIEFEESLLKAFDAKAGHPKFYCRREHRVPVRRLGDGKAAFAWLYVAKPNRDGRRNVWPTSQYRSALIEAAQFWQLPPEHLEKMRSWRTQ